MHRALLVLLVLAATLLVSPHSTALAQPAAAPLAAYTATVTLSHTTSTQNIRVTVTVSCERESYAPLGAVDETPQSRTRRIETPLGSGLSRDVALDPVGCIG